MNMRTPRHLVESDPLMSNVPQTEGAIEITNEEWTAEELENAERHVEQLLMEEAFIDACFEEMLQEEESQWCHYTVLPMPTIQYTSPSIPHSTHMSSISFFDSTGNTVYFNNYYEQYTQYSSEQQKYSQTSKLNPEAPEFVPRGLAS